MSERCQHSRLATTVSLHTESAGYQSPTAQKRVAATTSSGRVSKNNTAPPSPFTFPAPLILPDDDLALDPTYPPQSFRSWKQNKDRNEVTAERNIIYVAAPPSIDPAASFIGDWCHSHAHDDGPAVTHPRTEDVVDYLSAYYHGLAVQLLPPESQLNFTTWDEGTKASSKAKTKASAPKYIALCSGTTSIRIRARRMPKGNYPYQLDLNNVLDAAIDILPSDAYALLLLVDHDLFEDDDDEFVCGRAYGGSRVAVVSSARYHPALDAIHGVEREHAWPASHCRDYIKRMCDDAGPPLKKRRVKGVARLPEPSEAETTSPIYAALAEHITLASSLLKSNATKAPSTALSLLYLSRLARTAAHELGHCLGIDHCTYYACSMQGSASLIEDARQPPYLCPVDDAKITAACGVSEEERCKRLREVCKRWEEGALFKSFGAWLDGRIGQLEDVVSSD